MAIYILLMVHCAPKRDDKTSIDKIAKVEVLKGDSSITKKPSLFPTWIGEIPLDTVTVLDMAHDFPSLESESAIKQWFLLKGLSGCEKCVNVSYAGDKVFPDLGRAKGYKIALDHDGLPTNRIKDYFIFLWEEKKKLAIFPLATVEDIRLGKNEVSNMMGGFYDTRSHGYFLIYKCENEQFIKIFDTLDYCDGYGLQVAVYEYHCLEFKPLRLNFSNIDVNKDGKKDLQFSGKLLNFCPIPGADRSDDKHLKPVSSQKYVVNFLYSNDTRSWVLENEDLCWTFYGKKS